ncbi:MAG: NAD(P)/FAD-dependent oxidoreductase [Dehalococcoidia bacterium]|nr:NAD(P)/FAD-dependent oxidoreductase [Dehalococcoidia bacterium]
MNRYDFVIVGGGPVGCRVATELAKAGHHVAVLEKNTAVGQSVCCTGIVSCECMRHFSIPPELSLHRFNSASVYTPAGTVLRMEREEVQAVAIDRGAFNAYMARLAQDSGADYLLGQHASEIQLNPDGVIVRSAYNGEVSYFSARAVVLTCGFASHFPHVLGLGKARAWTVGAQVEVEACDLHEVEVFLGRTLAPGYFAWLVPLDAKRALAGLMSDKQTSEYMAFFISELQRRGRVAALTGRPSYRGITLRAPMHVSAARVLLAGDVAGQVKPLTGGGLYFGMLCADIAASVLHGAIEKGDFSARSMSAYDKKCRELLGRELRLGWQAHRLFGRLSDVRIEKLARWAQRNNMMQKLSASSHVGFDWHGRAMLHLLKDIAWPFKKKNSL